MAACPWSTILPFRLAIHERPDDLEFQDVLVILAYLVYPGYQVLIVKALRIIIIYSNKYSNKTHVSMLF